MVVTGFNGANQLVNLRFIADGAKGAFGDATAAGDTFVVVDLCPAQVVAADGIDAAVGSTGAVVFNDGIIGAVVHTPAAANAEDLIDGGAVL